MYDIRDESIRGEYHVILNFIKELEVFSQDIEKEAMIRILEETTGKEGVEILNHVIMKNHAHLIIKVSSLQALASTMISINTRFAKFFNKHRQRKGRLFSKRYTSSPINSDKYLYTAFRYVSNNPVKAQICNSPWDYKWSAIHDYSKKEGCFYHKEIIERFNDYYKGAIFSFEEFIGDRSDERCILDIDRKTYYDSEAKKIFFEELRHAGLKRLDPEKQPQITGVVINRLRRIGLTYLQISEFSQSSLYKIKKSEIRR